MRKNFIIFGVAVLLLSIMCNSAKAQAIITTADQLREQWAGRAITC